MLVSKKLLLFLGIFNLSVILCAEEQFPVEIERNGDLIELQCSCFYENGTQVPSKGIYAKTLAKTIKENIEAPAKKVEKKIKNTMKEVGKKIKNTMKEVDNKIKHTMKEVNKKINDTTKEVKAEVKSMLKGAKPEINSTVELAEKVSEVTKKHSKINGNSDITLKSEFKIIYSEFPELTFTDFLYTIGNEIKIHLSEMDCTCIKKT